MIQVNVQRVLLAALGSYLFAHSVSAETAATAVPVPSAVSAFSNPGVVAPVVGIATTPSGAAQSPVLGYGAAAGLSTGAGIVSGQQTQTNAPVTSTSSPAAVAPSAIIQTAEAPLSAAEKAIADDNAGTEKGRPQQLQSSQIRQFGYSFFRTGSDSFAPQTDIPVGPDYTVGPGDSIILSSWGSLEGTYSLEVNRNGEIQLPRVGPLKVWGVSIDRLQTLIRSSMAKVFRDFEINVTMGKLRAIKIYVVGEVHNPGDYNISSLSTVINALSAAGGPLKGGSLRNVTIRRSGKIVDVVDLYDFFLKGDKSRDIRLQSGDTVFVPIIGATVGVTGSVKRPAIYELKGENSLKDLLELSGGLLPTGYLQRVQISRVTAHDRKTVNDFSLDPKGGVLGPEALAGSIPVRDLDLVKIFPINGVARDQVRLEGYVLRPGDYALKPGMRISSLLLPDNTLPEYYRDEAEITRLFPPDFHPEKIIFNPAKALTGDKNQDLELNEFDTIRLYSRWEMEEMPKVRISGEVQKPGEFRYFTNMTVRDLLMAAGNPKLTAYTKSAEISRIIHSGEAVTSSSIMIDLAKAQAGSSEANIPLQPFDELTVRKIPNWSEETDRYITLRGELVFPGTYPVYKGEKLSSLIARAGGFTPKAYLAGAKFTRTSVQKDQQLRMNEALSRAEQDAFRIQNEAVMVASSKEELDATRAQLEGIMRNIAMLKTVKAEGRVVLHLRQLDQFRSSAHDLELLGGDMLEVPPQPGSVNVFGRVYNQTSLVFEEDKDVADYLDKVGGSTRDAEITDSYIIRADGSVASYQNASGFLFYNSFFPPSSIRVTA